MTRIIFNGVGKDASPYIVTSGSESNASIHPSLPAFDSSREQCKHTSLYYYGGEMNQKTKSLYLYLLKNCQE